jgi:hypothetical protein
VDRGERAAGPRDPGLGGCRHGHVAGLAWLIDVPPTTAPSGAPAGSSSRRRSCRRRSSCSSSPGCATCNTFPNATASPPM